MTLLPRPRRPVDLDQPWEPRTYPAIPAAIGWVRADLRADLAPVAGAGEALVAAVVLCASEMFADTVDRALAGGRAEGAVCALSLRRLPEGGGRVLRLTVAERGAADADGNVPCPAPDGDGFVRGRGLVLIDHLAARWGIRRTASSGGEDSGVLWAEFDLPTPSRRRVP